MAIYLITGGTGYIGSHIAVKLLKSGHQCILYDNLSNSSSDVVNRIEILAGRRPLFRKGDIRDKFSLVSLFREFSNSSTLISGVIHCAGLKAVGESVQNPSIYWDNNLIGSFNLIQVMESFNCYLFLFSSSATVYGYPTSHPISEQSNLKPINPYGSTKLAVENLLRGFYDSSPDKWKIICLRYFNPVGAHPSSLIGESPIGTANNLFPLLTRVASGRLNNLQVFGNNWPTPDGTPIRDYIHVEDLAEGHLSALKYLSEKDSFYKEINLGTGKGSSVLEVIAEFDKLLGGSIKYQCVSRREGDAAITVADPSCAHNLLNWRATYSLESMCRDAWNWEKASLNIQ